MSLCASVPSPPCLSVVSEVPKNKNNPTHPLRERRNKQIEKLFSWYSHLDLAIKFVFVFVFSSQFLIRVLGILA
nr:hypothetical protein Iba_chr12aCG22860 [Ipomoea batatas]GMD64838.1 hypothetical protein Iba_chr12bCG28200 [Ipomoea batatas]GMD69775.1 hypothetical protein Iba_chr12dCG22300 [Ipomoea batatas]GMD73652.1 hypothetical protein Iba_chr12fCG20460 [Ipomoea batatas]